MTRSQTTIDAYETAKAGGKHAGWYEKQKLLTQAEIESGIRSFRLQISRHQSWIADPLTKTADFYNFDSRRQAALIAGWRQDIGRHEDCIRILQGVIKERNHEL